MLEIAESAYEKMVADCIRGYPYEACGMLIGNQGRIATAYPANNEAASARIYTVAPKDLLAADRFAEASGLEIVGVYHSHTHTEAYPSPTDVRQAPDPEWWYLLVSLRRDLPDLRAYRIRDGVIAESQLIVESAKMR